MRNLGWEERPLGKGLIMYCIDQVQHLPGLYSRYRERLDEARREAVQLRTERKVREALVAREVRGAQVQHERRRVPGKI